MTRKRALFAAAGALGMAAAVGTAAPAAASAPTGLASESSFDLLFGATRLQGTIQWFDTSARITGSLRAVSGTRVGQFLGSGTEAGSGACNTTNSVTAVPGMPEFFTFTRTCAINGGFDQFTVILTNPEGSFIVRRVIPQP